MVQRDVWIVDVLGRQFDFMMDNHARPVALVVVLA
jgi:hypothetical protein